QGRYARSARAYADAFARPDRPADWGSRRVSAARAALLAAAGAGKEAGPADEGERSRLRRQALGWLGAQLADWQKGIRAAPPAAQSSARRELWRGRRQGALAPRPPA